MRSPNASFAAASIVSILLAVAPPSAAQTSGMPVVGYADRLSVQPGETIRFMVRSELPRYRADLVRLVHGDTNPAGPGYREEALDSPINRDYPGRLQSFPTGSYVAVPNHPALQLSGSFTLAAWIYPTTPHKGVQGLLAKWSPSGRTGYAMVVEEDGSLGLWLGDGRRVERLRSGRSFTPVVLRAGEQPGGIGREPPHASRWYFVAATFDAASGKVTLYQKPRDSWPDDPAYAMVEKSATLQSVGQNDLPFLMAGLWDRYDAESQRVGGPYNGKIDSPRVFSRALSGEEVTALMKDAGAGEPAAAWDFSADISSRTVTDKAPSHIHGRTVQMPARAVTGHNWSGRETDFRRAPDQYGAIHFHDDDLDDCGWKVDFELQVPAALKSGVYAARLRAGNAEDYVPFFVRPKKGTATAKIAFLFPTFSYLAYAQGRPAFPQILSMYDRHSDGSGVAYSSRLRPLLTHMRPKVHMVSASTGLSAPHGLNADLHFTSWMEAKGYQYDVLTDEDLDAEGTALLDRYKVVLTGPHPEYYSGKMLAGIKQYLQAGGRLMYLGGNGFYWVTEMDPEERHTVEIRRWNGTQAWEAEPGEYHLSTVGEQGGLWRFRGLPPQALVGVGFTAQAWARNGVYRRQAGSFDPRAAFIFEGIGPQEGIGDFASLVFRHGAAGWEVDRADYALGTPPHALVLATATDLPPAYVHVVEEINSSNAGPVEALVKSDLVYFETPNGGAVFSVGSIAWFGALSANRYINNVARLTENVLKRFASDEKLPAPAAAPGPTATDGGR